VIEAVRISKPGGPDALEIVQLEPSEPGQGQIQVAVAAAGVNFIDVYQRAARAGYVRPTPFVPGLEGAGRVTAVGQDVTGFVIGDRVAWKSAPGSYAGRVLVDAWQAVHLPDDVSEETAAALMLQGMTAHFLVSDTYAVQPGDTVLVHAAAGGVGLLLTQLAKLKGARVIAVVGTAAKQDLARGAGADEVLRYDGPDIGAQVRKLTDGQGVAVAYDGVGAATFEASLASLRQRGYLVVYGASSGPVGQFDVERLLPAGSVYLTRPTLGHYTRNRKELLDRATELLGLTAAGRLTVHVGGRFPLRDAARAHRELEARRTSGKLLLIPADAGESMP
jgi:NADPH:quinone reductase